MDRGDKFCQNRGFWSVKIQLFQISTYDTSLEAQFYADQTLQKNLGLKINRKEGISNFLCNFSFAIFIFSGSLP